jgi:ferric enterobactin receptor
MGPENTLILVDGKPVTSRNSVRYGWRGDRDTRGDTSWVPAEMIDHIDVIRGPAAARYGNGAMGGVVNIVTKPATSEWHGSWNTYMNALSTVKRARRSGQTSASMVRYRMRSALIYGEI